MIKILLSTALISVTAYSMETVKTINVYPESNQDMQQIRIYPTEQTLLNKLLPSDKVHNLANNIRKDKKNLVNLEEDIADIDCEIRFICYFNATMQALHASPTFREFINELCKNGNQPDESYISKDIKELFEWIESGRYSSHITGHVLGCSNKQNEDTILSKAELYNENIVKKLANKLEHLKPGNRGDSYELYDEVCEKLEEEAKNKKIKVPYSFNMSTLTIRLCKNESVLKDENKYNINVLNIVNYGIDKKKEQCKLPKCNLTDCLYLHFTDGYYREHTCNKNNCVRYIQNNYFIDELPKLLVFWNFDNNDFSEISVPKDLYLCDAKGRKKYTLVSLTNITHYGNLDKTHLVASVRLKDDSWIELNDLLKDGVAPQGIPVEFTEMPAEKPVRIRDLMFYEQL